MAADLPVLHGVTHGLIAIATRVGPLTLAVGACLLAWRARIGDSGPVMDYVVKMTCVSAVLLVTWVGYFQSFPTFDDLS